MVCPPTNFLSYKEFRILRLGWLWELVDLTTWPLFWGISTGCLYLPDWNLRSCFLRISVSTIKVHLTSASYSSFRILHGYFALPCNPYFWSHTALIPYTMVRGRLPSLLLNCGTLYLNILSQPRPWQLLKRLLRLTFFVATSVMSNVTFVV